MDPRLLQAFLSRPRKISEVAEHFAIPIDEAEKLLMKAVESGEVLLSSASEWKAASDAAILAGQRVTRQNIPGEGAGGRHSKFPCAQGHAVHSNFRLRPHTSSLFMVERGRPLAVRGKPEPIVISTVTSRKKSTRKAGSLTIDKKVLLYETLLTGPKTLTELRKRAEITRNNLNGLLRNRLIGSSWGPKGVGVLFEITQEGIGELERLKAASRIDVGLAKMNFISSKTTVTR